MTILLLHFPKENREIHAFLHITSAVTGFRSRHSMPGTGILQVNYSLEWQHSRGLVGTRIQSATPAPIHICPHIYRESNFNIQTYTHTHTNKHIYTHMQTY